MQNHGHQILFYLPYIVSIVFVGIGLPLALNPIEPNAAYGIRTEYTLSDPAVWYAVNSAGGWSMVVFSSLSAIIVRLLHKRWVKELEKRLIATAFIPIVMIVVSVAASVPRP